MAHDDSLHEENRRCWDAEGAGCTYDEYIEFQDAYPFAPGPAQYSLHPDFDFHKFLAAHRRGRKALIRFWTKWGVPVYKDGRPVNSRPPTLKQTTRRRVPVTKADPPIVVVQLIVSAPVTSERMV